MNSTVSVSSSLGDRRRRRFEQRRPMLAARSGPLAAALVDQPPARRPEQPATRVRRDALARPVVGRGDERLLDGVLGGVEVARSGG